MRRPVKAVRITAFGVSVGYSLVLHFSGLNLEHDVRRIVAYLPAAAALMLVAWDLWVWRWPLVRKITPRPRLDGLWEVSLTPTEESHIPPGGNRGPITSYVAITQSYWSIAIRQYTAESTSISRSFFWDNTDGTGTESITFTYDNTPMRQHIKRSPRHLGTCALRPGHRRPSKLEGWYFTDRYTQGDMKLTLIGRNVDVGSFEEAREAAKKAAAKPKVQRRWFPRALR